MIQRRNLHPNLQFELDTAAGYPDTGEMFMVCKSSLAAFTWLQNRMPGDRLFTTIAAANAAMTANAGEKCYVAEEHTESSATEIALAKAGTEFLGLGYGNRKPTLTTTGAVNAISLDAAGIHFGGFNFAAPGIDAVTADIDVVGAGCRVSDIISHGSTTAKNKVASVTITATAHDLEIDGYRLYNKTVEMPKGFSLEGAAERVKMNEVIVQDAVGFTSGSLDDSAAALMLEVTNSVFANAKADTVVVDFTSNTTGFMRNCYFNGRHTTIQSNVIPGSGMAFFECYGVEEAAKNGLLMPVADAE